MARNQRNITRLTPKTPSPSRRPSVREVQHYKDAPRLDQSLESFYAIAGSLEEQQQQLLRLATQALIVLEGERSRLARELDRDVSQSLVAALSELRRIERIAIHSGLGKNLAALETMIASALERVQRVARLLSPPISETAPPPQRVQLTGTNLAPAARPGRSANGSSMHAWADVADAVRPGTAAAHAATPDDDQARRLRVLLAEGHVVVRAGLRRLAAAEPDLEVVGEASDCAEAVCLVGELRPDVVVIDLTTPTLDGLNAIREIASIAKAPAILVLTVHDDQHYLRQLLEAGASGYVLKNSADTDLMTGVRAVAVGGIFLSASAAQSLLRLPAEHEREHGNGFGSNHLSEREREVLRLTAEGYTNQEIGAKLYLSPKTVDTYRQRITGKLDLHHRSELVRYALRQGLLAP